MTNPTEHNDRPKLELSGTWKPLCRHCNLSLDEEKAPDVLFLMKTKQTVDEMKNIQAHLHYNSMLAITCVCRVGGLAMLWKAIKRASKAWVLGVFETSPLKGFSAVVVYGRLQWNFIVRWKTRANPMTTLIHGGVLEHFVTLWVNWPRLHWYFHLEKWQREWACSREIGPCLCNYWMARHFSTYKSAPLPSCILWSRSNLDYHLSQHIGQQMKKKAKALWGEVGIRFGMWRYDPWGMEWSGTDG